MFKHNRQNRFGFDLLFSASSLEPEFPDLEFDDRCHKVQEPKFDCMLFDLDDTLYPLNSRIAGHVNNIEDYMVQKLGIDESKIENLVNLQVIRWKRRSDRKQ